MYLGIQRIQAERADRTLLEGGHRELELDRIRAAPFPFDGTIETVNVRYTS